MERRVEPDCGAWATSGAEGGHGARRRSVPHGCVRGTGAANEGKERGSPSCTHGPCLSNAGKQESAADARLVARASNSSFIWNLTEPVLQEERRLEAVLRPMSPASTTGEKHGTSTRGTDFGSNSRKGRAPGRRFSQGRGGHASDRAPGDTFATVRPRRGSASPSHERSARCVRDRGLSTWRAAA